MAFEPGTFAGSGKADGEYDNAFRRTRGRRGLSCPRNGDGGSCGLDLWRLRPLTLRVLSLRAVARWRQKILVRIPLASEEPIL